MSIALHEIVMRLRPNAAFSLVGETISALVWLTEPAPPPITEIEIEHMRQVITDERAAVAYRARRAAEYPALGDQLDDLYKRGAFSPEMTARIKAVKDKYPKPSSV